MPDWQLQRIGNSIARRQAPKGMIVNWSNQGENWFLVSSAVVKIQNELLRNAEKCSENSKSSELLNL